MPADRSEAEVRAQQVVDMGEDLGRVYNALYHDLSWLHMRWRMFRQVFATSPERADVLNATAPAFFASLETILVQDVVLELARMTDPPRSAGRDNLSLRKLPGLIEDLDLKAQVESTLATVVERCEPMRDWRNRRLAHRDLELATKTASEELAGVSRATIEAALESCRTLLNLLELHYRDGTVAYEQGVIGSGDGDSLAFYLEAGLKAVAQEYELERRKWLGEV